MLNKDANPAVHLHAGLLGALVIGQDGVSLGAQNGNFVRNLGAGLIQQFERVLLSRLHGG